jgi:single-strand DNA-binding protein
MNGMNKVFLMGYLGSDPKKLISKTGNSYTRFNLATHRQWRNEEGTPEKRTDWHTIFVWGRRGESCAEFLRKGAPVLIEGYLSTFDITTDDGQTVHKTGVTAHGVEFLAKKAPAHRVAETEREVQEIPF